MTVSYDLIPAHSFQDIDAPAPDFARLQADYDELTRALEAAQDARAALKVLERWEHVRRGFTTWSNLTELRFQQDTKNADARAASDLLNELRPKINGLEVALKRKFLAHPLREELEREAGQYLFTRWELDVTAFDPAIELQTVREAQLGDEYVKLLAEAEFEFNGEQLNLSTIAKYSEHPDRELRRGAMEAKWAFIGSNAGELDRLFDELVSLRDDMAHVLEFHSFTELGYRRMLRSDYGVAQVANYRDEIAREIVPLAQRIRDRQAQELGVDTLMFWDETMFSGEPPRPPQAYDEMIARSRSAFRGVNEGIGSFVDLMIDGNLVDLRSRDAKANGGFCTSFPSYGMPFVFANFNGTTHDVNVLLHEMGHAFQCYSSRQKPVSEYLWPTYEACEVHSMSMEFLAWPQLEKFFGSDAQRYREQHLQSTIVMLPYVAAVDQFQHYVYDNPKATPAQRNAMWKQLEATYLPWRRYGGIAHLEAGGLWQVQRHIYMFPFYYIDYGLAMCCALQFWSWSLDDYDAALKSYISLCERGGILPFQALVTGAGLKSPFEPGVLREVATRVATVLGLE